MEKRVKAKRTQLKKRNLFAELTDGMTALAEARQGKRALRKHAAKSLFDRARTYIGAVKERLKPRNTSAQANLKEALELFFESADPEEIKTRLHNDLFVTRVEVAIG